MKRFVTILAILACVAVAVLAVLTYWLEQELDSLKRKSMTAAARAARWSKKDSNQQPDDQQPDDQERELAGQKDLNNSEYEKA